MIEQVERPATAATGSLLMLDPREIMPDPHNERGAIAADTDPDFEGLVESIRANGVLEPLRVYRVDDVGYVVNSGHRRRAAAILAGLGEVPCFVVEAPDHFSPRADIERLVANIQRRDIDDISKAKTIHVLRGGHPELTQAELAARLGMSQPALANVLRLLELPVEVQQLIADGKLSKGHGLALLALHDGPCFGYDAKPIEGRETKGQTILAMAGETVRQSYSVHGLEGQIKSHNSNCEYYRTMKDRSKQYAEEERKREAERLGVSAKELAATKKKAQQAKKAEEADRGRRTRIIQETIISSCALSNDGPTKTHLQIAALALAGEYISEEDRKAWGLPSRKEIQASIVAVESDQEVIAWIARLSIAKTVRPGWDAKSFYMNVHYGGEIFAKALVDDAWGLSAAIEKALGEKKGGE